VRPYVLAETSWADARDAAYDLAVLPWGATEPHNLHLPYATDVILAGGVATEAARRAWERGARVLVLPAVPFGSNASQLGLGPTVEMRPSTQRLVLRDVVASLEAAGIESLAIVNGHGGNDFKPIVRELQAGTDVFLCALDWWRAADARAHFAEPGDHAGALETAAVMHLRPDLVRPLAEAGDGTARRWRVGAFNEGWAWAPRDWRQVTADTGVGDPREATPETGAAFVDACAERIAGFFADLAGMDPTDAYE
jgi:creatinine amidohydrolase